MSLRNYSDLSCNPPAHNCHPSESWGPVPYLKFPSLLRSYIPFAFKDNEKPAGFDYDVTKAVFASIGYDFKLDLNLDFF